MNHSRRRQVTAARVSVVVAVVAGTGCGSGASPSSEATEAHSAPKRAEARQNAVAPRSETRGPQSRPVAQDEDFFAEEPSKGSAPSPYMCTREVTAFDLSALTPADPTPAAFAASWIYERAKSELPGFVVVFSGGANGPVVQSRFGSVFRTGSNEYSLLPSLPISGPEDVLRKRDDFSFVTATYSARDRDLITAFGTERQRSAFRISQVTVQGRLDATCETLRDVVVTMTLPKSNIGQPFGGTTVDESLGPMTVDTDGDHIPDSWSIALEGKSLRHLNVRL